jgi:hydroxymethylpyrimidine pyrophosphatase-like HAD family hydrolase
MYFLALATDYDGTIAHHGTVDAPTLAALERFKKTGRRLILVTGRELPDLKRVFPEVTLFNLVVAENGALLYDPATEKEHCIAPSPPPAFVDELRRRGVTPLSVGRSIVATWEPHEKTVIDVIRDMALDMQIIFNKGAVMILPAGMNKAAGLRAGLKRLDLAEPNVVAVGDAENDHAFLLACGCSAAVANALATVRDECDIVLGNHHGAGVAELVEMICREDVRLLPAHRHGLLVGQDRAGEKVYLEPHRGTVLIAGSSGIGKSTLATAITERMVEKSLEFCVFDPEGDFAELEGAVSVGDPKTPPILDESLNLLRKLSANVVVNTQALRLDERPTFFARILPQVLSLRARTGRPHWLLIDEAHHLLSAEREDVVQVLPEHMPATIFITVHPETIAPAALKRVEYVMTLGPNAAEVIASFCAAAGVPPPPLPAAHEEREILFWERSKNGAPIVVKPLRPQQAKNRHVRKYAEGELPKDFSFYFRGPDNKLNLRAQNLMLFAQIAEGVDDATWEHHRRIKDYSGWFRRVIKDDELTAEAEAAETDLDLDAAESRRRIIDAINKRYTAPARAPR